MNQTPASDPEPRPAPAASGAGPTPDAPTTAGRDPDPVNRGLQRALMILLAAVSLATTLAVLVLILGNQRNPGDTEPGGLFADPLPLSPFQLIERSGEPFTDADFNGRISVVVFFFTQCTSFCPAMSGRLAELQGILQARPDWPDFQLISVTVDPERDTPEVLRAYADRFGADPNQWLFLTGSIDDVYQRTMRQAFRMPIPTDFEATEDHEIAHSDRFVLVDRQGAIRGFYPALEDAGWRTLLDDIDRLAAEPINR